MTTPRPKTPWLILGIILAAAFALRAAVALTHPFFLPDSSDYETLAKAILHRQEYRIDAGVAVRMPGYPVFVAGVFSLFGESVRAVLLVQAALGAACCGIAYLLGRRLAPAVGLLAAALVALDPLSVAFSAAFLSEIPFTFIFLLAIYTLLRIIEDGRFAWWILLGLLWPTAVYLRASALWLLIPLALTALAMRWWTAARVPPAGADGRGAAAARMRGKGPIQAAGALAAVALTFLALTPWLNRNYNIFHSGYLRLTTLEGISLYEAVYPQADGGPQQHKILLPQEMRTLNEAQRNDEWLRRAHQEIQNSPARTARLALVKIARTWSPWLNAEDYRAWWMQAVMAAWHLPIYALALASLLRRKIPPPLLGPALVSIVYFTVLHALFLGSVRYRVPLMPLVDLAAAVTLWRLWKKNGSMAADDQRQGPFGV